MMALMGDNPALGTLRTQLIDLQTQRSQMALKFGPKHPQIVQIDQQINKVQNQITTKWSWHGVR